MKLRRRGPGGGWRSMLPGGREARPWIVALAGVVLAFVGGYLVAAQLLFPPEGEAVDAPLVEVPALSGMAVDEARARLGERGLEGRILYRPASTEADSGTVMAQRPLAGQLTRSGGSVELTVSRGPGTVRVPGLRGLAEARARAVLEELGLEVTSRQEPSSVRSGEVVGTEPSAGAELRRQAEIALVVSEGPEVARVPELVGRHIDDVPRVLRGASLELGPVEFDPGAAAAPGRVVGQSPPPGFSLRRGGSVSVRVAGARGDWSPPAPEAEAVDPDTSASGSSGG